MADNIFTRLGRLFQSRVIIRKTDDNRLNLDIDIREDYELLKTLYE